MALTNSITNTAFIINMINYCIGIGLLAKAYCVAISGWYSMISTFMAFLFVYYSGIVFAKSTLKAYGMSIDGDEYEMVNQTDTNQTDIDQTDIDQTDIESITDNEEAVVSDDDDDININELKNKSVFQVLGKKAFGGIYGEYYVNICTLLLWINSSTINVIICWELLLRIIEHILINNKHLPIYFEQHIVYIYMFICLLPFVFLLKWRELTFVSKISVFSITLLGITMIYVLILWFIDSAPSLPSAVPYVVSSDTDKNIAQYAILNMNIYSRMFSSFSIFTFGINATAGIPPMVIALENKNWKNIKSLIFISYLIATIFCLLFGVIGALIYGKNVDVLVLNNLFIWPSGIFVLIVIIIKIINLWTSFGIISSLAGNTLDASFNINQSKKRYLIRLCFILLVISLSYLCRHNLALLTIMIGVAPSQFNPFLLYIIIFYKKLSCKERIFNISLFILVIVATIDVLLSSFQQLI